MPAKKNPHAVALGRKGGSVASEAQKRAARANGKRGGRPPTTPSPEPPMTTANLYKIAAEIDDLNMRVGDLVGQIRYGRHPDAFALADALEEECVILAGARIVVDNVLGTTTRPAYR